MPRHRMEVGDLNYVTVIMSRTTKRGVQLGRIDLLDDPNQVLEHRVDLSADVG